MGAKPVMPGFLSSLSFDDIVGKAVRLKESGQPWTDKRALATFVGVAILCQFN